MNSALKNWLRVSLFNLMLVALIGTILRYKIIFSLPFVNQKFLMEGHSHFAFAGWITQTLMVLLVAWLSEVGGRSFFIRYRPFLYGNVVTAYAMLLSFPLTGYGWLSIVASTISIFVSYFFAVIFWSDLNKLPGKHASRPWFKTALICNVLSSAGPFNLAYMMAVKSIEQKSYLATIYFFLHFQYNGWFFFACMGLLIYQLAKLGLPAKTAKRSFLLLGGSVVPAYFLSVLWWPIPWWLYILVAVAACLQIAGWFTIAYWIGRRARTIAREIHPVAKLVFIFSAVALTVKLLLQAGSVIPSLSKLAFGFRPIVIGYLHLVFLGVVSLFLFAYCAQYKMITLNKASLAGIKIFAFGVIANELLLMIQGVADMGYQSIPFINESLLIAAFFLFLGMLTINWGQSFHKTDYSPRMSERFA